MWHSYRCNAETNTADEPGDRIEELFDRPTTNHLQFGELFKSGSVGAGSFVVYNNTLKSQKEIQAIITKLGFTDEAAESISTKFKTLAKKTPLRGVAFAIGVGATAITIYDLIQPSQELGFTPIEGNVYTDNELLFQAGKGATVLKQENQVILVVSYKNVSSNIGTNSLEIGKGTMLMFSAKQPSPMPWYCRDLVIGPAIGIVAFFVWGILVHYKILRKK
jgi:hypothetical protein